MAEYWDITGSWVEVAHPAWAVFSDARRWRRSLEDPVRQYLYHDGSLNLDEMPACLTRLPSADGRVKGIKILFFGLR